MNRALRIFTIVIVVLFLAFMSSWLWIKSVERSRWSRLRERVAELHHEADLRCGPRPVLRGEALPGDAWDDYLPAIEKVANISNVTPVWRLLVGGTPEERSTGEALLTKYGEAVDLMQRGTRRGASRRMRLHEHEIPETYTEGTPLNRANVVGTLAVAKSRLLSEQGRHLEAAELLLDVCRFAEDVGRDGSSMAHNYGHSILRTAIVEFGERLAEAPWTIEQLSQFDRELAAIDGALPPSEASILGELERLGELILNDRLFAHRLRGPVPKEYLPGWRHTYSMQLLMTSGFDVVDGAVGRIRHADTGSWSEEVKRWKEFQEDLEASKNIAAGLYGEVVPHESRRMMQTQIRLLRMGVHYATTGEVLALEDPFGTRLLHRQDTDKVTLWSVGKDAVDDQGTGAWNRPTDKDIVLHIRRAKR